MRIETIKYNFQSKIEFVYGNRGRRIRQGACTGRPRLSNKIWTFFLELFMRASYHLVLIARHNHKVCQDCDIYRKYLCRSRRQSTYRWKKAEVLQWITYPGPEAGPGSHSIYCSSVLRMNDSTMFHSKHIRYVRDGQKKTYSIPSHLASRPRTLPNSSRIGCSSDFCPIRCECRLIQ